MRKGLVDHATTALLEACGDAVLTGAVLTGAVLAGAVLAGANDLAIVAVS